MFMTDWTITTDSLTLIAGEVRRMPGINWDPFFKKIRFIRSQPSSKRESTSELSYLELPFSNSLLIIHKENSKEINS